MSRLGLVHLARYANGTEPLRMFVESYVRHPAGIDHELLIVFKGFPQARLSGRWRNLLSELELTTLFVGDDGVDIGAYLYAARQSRLDTLCFLNSFSLVLDSGWLAKLAAHQQQAIGVVSATGSWESTFSNALTEMGLDSSLRGIRRSRLVSRRIAFPRFPNPHVRTNAFLMRRDAYIALDFRGVGRRAGALRFESGRRSLTRQLESKGLAAVVVGRDGQAYPSEAWPASRTFRSGSQENLMIADNRTDQYARADPATRDRLARFSWGTEA